jgi:hypothetical protein
MNNFFAFFLSLTTACWRLRFVDFTHTRVSDAAGLEIVNNIFGFNSIVVRGISKFYYQGHVRHLCMVRLYSTTVAGVI